MLILKSCLIHSCKHKTAVRCCSLNLLHYELAYTQFIEYSFYQLPIYNQQGFVCWLLQSVKLAGFCLLVIIECKIDRILVFLSLSIKLVGFCLLVIPECKINKLCSLVIFERSIVRYGFTFQLSDFYLIFPVLPHSAERSLQMQYNKAHHVVVYAHLL